MSIKLVDQFNETIAGLSAFYGARVYLSFGDRPRENADTAFSAVRASPSFDSWEGDFLSLDANSSDISNSTASARHYAFQNCFLEYDLSDVPDGLEVHKAELKLRDAFVVADETATLEIYQHAVDPTQLLVTGVSTATLQDQVYYESALHSLVPIASYSTDGVVTSTTIPSLTLALDVSLLDLTSTSRVKLVLGIGEHRLGVAPGPTNRRQFRLDASPFLRVWYKSKVDLGGLF